MRSDCRIFFLIAIVANVLNSDVFKSEGSKSSTNSLRQDLSSREKLLFISFNSIADFGFEYLIFRSLIASLIELISELRTLATIAIKKKILQSDLILLRGSGAYDHIKELLEKKFIVKRRQKDGRSYWLSLSEKFFQTFAVSNEYLTKIGSHNNKQQ